MTVKYLELPQHFDWRELGTILYSSYIKTFQRASKNLSSLEGLKRGDNEIASLFFLGCTLGMALEADDN